MGAFVSLRSGLVVAQTPDGDVAPRHVEIKMVPAADVSGGLEVSLRELLARLQVTVTISNLGSVDERHILSPHPGEPLAVARVWIDLRNADHVILYLAGMKDDRILVRRVPLVGHIDEVAKEEIAHIVEATVDALLVGGRIGVATDEGSRTAPQAPPRPTGVHLDLGIGYSALAWSSSKPLVQGPAIFVGAGTRDGVIRPAFLLEGAMRFPVTIDSDPLPVSARLDQGSVRAMGMIDWSVSKPVSLLAGLGGGVDFVRISPEAQAGALATSDRFVTLPMLRGLLMMRYSFTSRGALFLGAGADFDWLSTRYLIQNSAGEEVVFEPWRLRPLAFLGVSSDVLAH